MQKQAPSTARIAVALAFSLSCFGLLLFLWVAFGGPSPLKPQSYRITADFPEAATLSVESDVRIGGVSVGKVKSLDVAPREGDAGPEATRVEIEIEPRFAPISADARAILRLKTLLGETYVELTSGTGDGAPVSLGDAVELSDALAASSEPIPEGGHLDDARVVEAVQIDEIFNALDEETRASFQRWQQSAGRAIRGRGLDLNDALGNFGPFVEDSARIVAILERQRAAVGGLIRDTGTVFEAATARDRQLAGLIRSANAGFAALASRDRELAETLAIFPTFERESRLTFERLDDFREGAEPLVDELGPVARDLAPTTVSLSKLSPELRALFRHLDPLIDASRRGLPAFTSTIEESGPVIDALDPFIANLAPTVRYLRAYRSTLTDFLSAAPSGIAGILDPVPGQPAPLHTVRQFGYNSSESLAIADTRFGQNRGNAYLPPDALALALGQKPPVFDCRNTDYPPWGPSPPDPDEDEFAVDDPMVSVGFAPCLITPDFSGYGLDPGRYPQLHRDP